MLHGPKANLNESVRRCPYSTCNPPALLRNLSGEDYCSLSNATGLLCSKCQDGFFLETRGTCEQCSSSAFIAFILTLMLTLNSAHSRMTTSSTSMLTVGTWVWGVMTHHDPASATHIW